MYKFYFVLISLLWFQHDSVQRGYSVELSQNDILNALKIHNKARIEVGVNEIEWSDDLSDQAQEWANNLAKKDKIYHSSSESRVNQGENLYYSFTSQNRKPVFSKSPAKDASLAWYNEINDYKYSAYGSKLNESVMIGHYTQMVWKSTTKVGIALARSSEGKEYIVARYSPPGNYLGKYPY